VDTLTLLCTVIPVTVTATLGTKYYFAFRGKQLEFNSARDTENFLREEAERPIREQQERERAGAAGRILSQEIEKLLAGESQLTELSKCPHCKRRGAKIVWNPVRREFTTYVSSICTGSSAWKAYFDALVGGKVPHEAILTINNCTADEKHQGPTSLFTVTAVDREVPVTCHVQMCTTCGSMWRVENEKKTPESKERQ